jgi:hypothetical protein
MFTVRTVHPEDGRAEVAQFDLEPTLPQGRTVCNLFADFLAGHPAEFREKLPFLNKGDIELQWAAASGGAAFAALFAGGQTLAIAVLLSGAGQEADAHMLEALSVSVVEPMLGQGALQPFEDRPGVLLLPFNDQPELLPTAHLLITALASVYFRAVHAMTAARN